MPESIEYWKEQARLREQDYATLLQRWKEEQKMRLEAEREVDKLKKMLKQLLDEEGVVEHNFLCHHAPEPDCPGWEQNTLI